MIHEANDSTPETPKPEKPRIVGSRRIAMLEALARAGCVHPDALIDLADPGAVTLGRDREPMGVDREVRRLQERFPNLFTTTPAPRHGTPPRQGFPPGIGSSEPRGRDTERFFRSKIHYPG